jgi:hypothetical protein
LAPFTDLSGCSLACCKPVSGTDEYRAPNVTFLSLATTHVSAAELISVAHVFFFFFFAFHRRVHADQKKEEPFNSSLERMLFFCPSFFGQKGGKHAHKSRRKKGTKTYFVLSFSSHNEALIDTVVASCIHSHYSKIAD